MERANEGKREGWWTGLLFTEADAKTRFGVAAEWDTLPQWLKNELMAYARARDTMEAWERHLSETAR